MAAALLLPVLLACGGASGAQPPPAPVEVPREVEIVREARWKACARRRSSLLWPTAVSLTLPRPTWLIWPAPVALQFRWFPFVGANNYSPLHARQRHFAKLNHLKRNATPALRLCCKKSGRYLSGSSAPSSAPLRAAVRSDPSARPGRSIIRRPRIHAYPLSCQGYRI